MLKTRAAIHLKKQKKRAKKLINLMTRSKKSGKNFLLSPRIVKSRKISSTHFDRQLVVIH